MTARYWVQIADELMAHEDLQWPAVLRPVEQGASEYPGSHWWLLEDDDAPEDLDGKKVDLTLSRVSDMTMIERRRLQ